MGKKPTGVAAGQAAAWDIARQLDGGDSRWIPVEERLPEEGERVLFYNGNCTVDYSRYPRIGVCIDDGPTGTKQLRIVDLLLRQLTPNRDETWPDVEATHWMPLPPHPDAK